MDHDLASFSLLVEEDLILRSPVADADEEVAQVITFPLNLPSPPPPSLSPSSSRTHLRISRSEGPPPLTSGLDMSKSPERYQSRFRNTTGSPTKAPARSLTDAGAGLDDVSYFQLKEQHTSKVRRFWRLAGIAAGFFDLVVAHHKPITSLTLSLRQLTSQEVYRTRQARSGRAQSTTNTFSASKDPASSSSTPQSLARSPSPTFSSSPNAMDDPRDSQSARENIMALAAKGGEAGQASLASFMGGGSKPPPLHRVNQGMTEQEREETEKLEQEMAAKKSRWAHQEDDQQPPKGPSLADLMKSKSTNESPVAASVANRWKSVEPIKAYSAPTPLQPHATDGASESTLAPTSSSSRPPFVSSPATSYTRPTPAAPAEIPNVTTQKLPSPTSLSLAAAFGSKASGPKLNQPTAISTGEEGPAHARPVRGGGAVAMPGMVAAGTVRERTKSFSGGSSAPPAATAPPAVIEHKVFTRSPPIEQTSVVEAKVISRSPVMESSPFQPRSPEKATPSFLPSTSAARFASEPSPMNKMAPTASLTRLQSSNIVSNRMGMFNEQKDDASLPDSTTKTGQGKRGSVVGRWGRDQPDSSLSSAPSSPATMHRTVSAPKVEQVPARQESIETLVVPDDGAVEVPAPGNSPPLVHLNRDRPRPQKSTPRSLPSTSVEPKSEPTFILPPVAAMGLPSPPVFPSRSDPSPRFDSPQLGDDPWGDVPMSREPSTRDDLPRLWAGPPIGVREPNRGLSFPRTEEVAEVKHTRGIALPGMSVRAPVSPTKPSDDPTMSRLIASQYETSRGLKDIQYSDRYTEPDRPSAMAMASSIGQTSTGKTRPIPAPIDANPWSRPTSTDPSVPVRTRTTSITTTAAKRMSRIDFDDEVPRSPGGTLKDRLAMFSNPNPAPHYNAAAVKESYGVKVSSDSGARPTRSRQVSMDFSARKAAYAAAAESPTKESFSSRLTRQPSKPALVASKTSAPIEIFALNSSTSTQPLSPGSIFSGDLLAIVDRTTRTGTKLWIWKGKDASLDEKAVEELSQQHGTGAIIVLQTQETSELVALFGSPLLIRTGSRSAYDEHDPCLLRAQSVGDRLILDELPMASKSLCSGFTYVLASSGDIYVWQGVGTSSTERAGAAAVAKSLASGRGVSELIEGDEPDHFWHALGGAGGEEYASSHFWRFRSTVPTQVSIYSVDSGRTRQSSSSSPDKSSISIIDTGMELWVVVPAALRENISDLKTAFASAEKIAAGWKARSLPFRPAQHVLFFPTIVPRDLAQIRRLDLDVLNNGITPGRMDVSSLKEALEAF
ncbi:hypothetical protein P7C70_g2798, partial [Phenoliferia sp. Uapishka_3]